jgi:hypothetical protein
MTQSVPGRGARTTFVAVASVALAIALAAAAWRTSGAQARGACSQTREKQSLSLTVSWRYREQLSRVDNGQLQQRTVKDQTRAFGRLLIAGSTCKKPGGAWRVIDPIGVSYSSVGLGVAGNITSSGLLKGWGIGMRSGAGGSSPGIKLQIMHCGKGNFFKTLKFLAGVPVPILPFKVVAGVFVVGQFLPKDKVTCGDVGVKPLRVYASDTGVLRVADLSVAAGCCTEMQHFPSPNGGWNYTRSYSVNPVAGG